MLHELSSASEYDQLIYTLGDLLYQLDNEDSILSATDLQRQINNIYDRLNELEHELQ
jgi:chaperonin cofactor prefoldin